MDRGGRRGFSPSKNAAEVCRRGFLFFRGGFPLTIGRLLRVFGARANGCRFCGG